MKKHCEMEKLKACPFCGVVPFEPYNENADTKKRPLWRVECKRSCISMGRPTKREVVADWNTRDGKL